MKPRKYTDDIHLSQLPISTYEVLKSYDWEKEKEILMYKWKYEGCSKILPKPWNLLDHVRMHYGIKPYICEYCGNGFTQKGNLKKHMRQHVNPDVGDRKRHSCRFCGKGYTERYNLKVGFSIYHLYQFDHFHLLKFLAVDFILQWQRFSLLRYYSSYFRIYKHLKLNIQKDKSISLIIIQNTLIL